MQVDVWLLAREVIAQSSDLQGSSFGEHRAASELQVPSTLRLHPTGPHLSCHRAKTHPTKDFSAYLNPQGASANFRLHVAEKIEAAFAVATEKKTFTLDRNKKREVGSVNHF